MATNKQAAAYTKRIAELETQVAAMVQMMQRIAEDVLPDPVRYAVLTPEMVRDGFIKAWQGQKAQLAVSISLACTAEKKLLDAEVKIASLQDCSDEHCGDCCLKCLNEKLAEARAEVERLEALASAFEPSAVGEALVECNEKLEQAESEMGRLHHEVEDAKRSRDDAIGRCVEAQAKLVKVVGAYLTDSGVNQ